MHGFFWTVTTLLYFSFLHHAGDVTAQLTAAPPTCPGRNFTFRCTVTGDRNGITIWRVNGSSECTLVHRSTSSSICGPGDVFTARSGTGFGTTATSFTSTLSGAANLMLNSTLVECFGPANNVQPENRVGSSALQILGPPSVSTLSCVDLSEGVSGAVNVTVSWTLSSGDSADFYLINITTNAPQTPYGGLLNITTSVTQHQLTDFMAGFEYSITVHGVNCGSLEGRESEPLTIRPQVPEVPSSCNITLSYEQLSRRLLFINSSWNTVPNPTDPDPGEACLGPSGDVNQYQISFQTGSSVVANRNMNIDRCTAWRCSHTFDPPSNPPSSYDNVSVAAENVVGVGAARTCTAQPISTTNNLLTGRIVNASSLNNMTIICIFLSGFTGSARCRIQYGTDPTYMNLPYSAESTETGTAGDIVSVILRERLNSSTVYYYTVSAVSGDIAAVVRGVFTTLQYRCSLTDLVSTDVVGQLADRRFVNTLTIPSGMVCQSRTTAQSQALYICGDEDGAATRMCQSYWTWNGSIPQCSPDPGRKDGAVQPLTTGATVGIAVAVTAVVTFIAGVLSGILLYHCFNKYQCQNSKPSFHKEHQPSFHQPPQPVLSSNQLPQTGPEYEEVVKLRKNASYEFTKSGIELKTNEAYQSTQN